jgi:putative flavoprotein involved in K+ transport
MRHTTTVVVGAGHCGLVMSRHLAAASIDHVVIERGEVAHSWRTQRWDSLRLLTPNWMTRLPGRTWTGVEPDGWSSVPELVALLAEYAEPAPLLTGTTVTAVTPLDRGFRVCTDRGTWHAQSVVVATGAAAVATRPALTVPTGTAEVTAADYRNPASLPDGPVLVVGASASGVQIADELARTGRAVTLAVGEHVRMPRTYRGRDILWWMDASGVLDERWDSVPDLVRARHLPSMQLIGARRTLDLAALQEQGVRVVGRLAGVRDTTAQFSGSLANVCALADLKLARLLDTFDRWADRAGVEAEPPQRFAPTPVPAPSLTARIGPGGIASVVWATGFRPDLSFLAGVPGVLDWRGRARHDGGITAAPGLYLMGLPFLRRRNSTLVAGAGADARDLAGHLAGHLGTAARRAG